MSNTSFPKTSYTREKKCSTLAANRKQTTANYAKQHLEAKPKTNKSEHLLTNLVEFMQENQSPIHENNRQNLMVIAKKSLTKKMKKMRNFT